MYPHDKKAGVQAASDLFPTCRADALDRERLFQETLSQCAGLGAHVQLSGQQLRQFQVIYHMALGIAGSMAAGSMAYLHDGAWTKRLHPGWACHAGITAAHLAAAGFIGPASILESSYGFLHAYSSASDISQLERQEKDEFVIMHVSIKPYARCRYMHGPIDCLLEIAHALHPNPDQIELVRCGVLTGGRGLIADPIEQKRQPNNVVEAQFSMPFGAAIAILM